MQPMVVLLAVRFSLNRSLRDLHARERWFQQGTQNPQYDAQRSFAGVAGVLDAQCEHSGMLRG